MIAAKLTSWDRILSDDCDTWSSPRPLRDIANDVGERVDKVSQSLSVQGELSALRDLYPQGSVLREIYSAQSIESLAFQSPLLGLLPNARPDDLAQPRTQPRTVVHFSRDYYRDGTRIHVRRGTRSAERLLVPGEELLDQMGQVLTALLEEIEIEDPRTNGLA